ncbi:MAG: CDP-6-deoxy-delta-3,4-glucoseen reductase [Burkholderiaceae bacterium]
MPFTVTIEPSARQFDIQEGGNILLAGIQAGVSLPYGCKDGACGSCRCKKISGSVTQGEHQARALSPEDSANGFILTCCATAHSDIVLESKQVLDVGMPVVKKMPVRLISAEKKASDVVLLKLQLPQTENFEYLAGQYIDFLLKDGQKRSYSIANATAQVLQVDATQSAIKYIELHVRHMPGGLFTDHVFQSLKDKEIFRIEGPLGGFFLRPSDKPMIFLASGTGLAPIKALIEDIMMSKKERTEHRPIDLYWGARSLADLYLHDWAQEVSTEWPALKYIPVLSEPKAEDEWTGRTGFVHLAVLQDHPDLSQHQVYACGAPVMVDSAKKDFTAKAQLLEDDFYADAFLSLADLRANIG